MQPIITITIPDKTAAKLTAVSASHQVNVSNSSKVYDNTNKANVRGFQLSPDTTTVVSALNGNYTAVTTDGYPGYLSYSLSTNSDGSVTLSFKVTGAVPKTLYVVFDAMSGEYATKYFVKNVRTTDTVEITDNDQVSALIDISGLNIQLDDTLEFTMQRWSVLHKSFKVTRISTFPEIILTDVDLISFNCSENLMDSEMSLSPGVCEQYATVVFYDRGQVVHQLAQEGILHNEASVNIAAVHNSVQYSLGSYVSESWDTESDESTITVNCRDKSYLFSSITIESPAVADRTLDNLLSLLFDAANINWAYLDSATQQRCSDITIEHAWFKSSDLLTLLNKICQLGMLRMYWYLDTFLIGRCA